MKNAAPMQQHYDTSSVFVAVIGRPNVGKSSLTNRILGENRMIVANEAGTTRDAIDTPVDNAYGKFIFTDTAGLRKRSNIRQRLHNALEIGLYRFHSGLLQHDLRDPYAIGCGLFSPGKNPTIIIIPF